ncbi:zinc finger C2HC domain-containing protein 1C isoform X3 [Plodia interpunctella]|uniref:zinc finger C2HC domain-containing protein 1C isoform X3 n=1 Tax=Plodia interpunctella TaxID=58824 RepID=UPI0023676CF3|nr:zinc finger C2HC domain-containing protein 1C isoform X3 [Plodia interpunctella]
METRNISRSVDHVNWWEPEHWKFRGPRSLSSVSLEGADPAEIRNGWITLPSAKARFQQKQLQEREMKIASLYEAQQARALERVRHSPSNGISSSPPHPQPPGKDREQKIASLYETQQTRALDRIRHSPGHGTDSREIVSRQPGKVRQMFEERRTKGIDKSYPLQPIHNTERTRKPIPNGFSKVSTTTRVTERRTVKNHVANSHIVKKQHKIENMVNGSGDVNHNHEADLNTMKNSMPHSNGEVVHSIDELDRDNNYLIEDETFPDALAPTPTPRSPDPQPPVRPQRRSPVPKTSPIKSKPQTVTPPRKAASENAVTDIKARGAMQRGPSNPQKPGSGSKRCNTSTSSEAGAGGAGEPCAVCGRRFAPDRLQKHQEICKKANNKKRKPFDALKHRLAGTEAENYKGTEAEPFINKLRKGATTSQTKVKPLNNNWRQKHEEFINAIRAAKQVQQHLDAGGKLSDLPPPPPSENPDYVQCPHCSRRFNQAAAERHIPKCASYQFNKPKPAAKRR